MKKLLIVGLGVVTSLSLLSGCSAKNDNTESDVGVVNELETDVIPTVVQEDTEVVESSTYEEVVDNENRVDVDTSATETKTEVPNKNRSSYSFDEIKFFNGLDTGSFTMKISYVNGDSETAVSTMDIRSDSRTGVVKMDMSLPTDESLNSSVNVQTYFDTDNSICYKNTANEGWVGMLNMSGINSSDDITVSSILGVNCAFDRTDEYYAYFKCNSSNNNNVVETILSGINHSPVTSLGGELKINRETLRMVDYTETFQTTISISDSEGNASTEDYTFKVKASIQDINSLGTIMIPNDIVVNTKVDSTKSSTKVYE